MKVYTKTGDRGSTSLIGGTRVLKCDVRLEAYGGVDELNAHLGMIRSYPLPEVMREELVAIQRMLFTLGGNLATDTEQVELKPGLVCREEDIEILEKAIDRMDEELPPMRFFVLPGGDPVVSACHIARTVCRRVERRLVEMQQQMAVDARVMEYVNRLSDYLFVLARKLAQERGVVEEVWKL